MQREFRKRNDFEMLIEFIQHQGRLSKTRFGQMQNSKKSDITSGIRKPPTRSIQVNDAQRCSASGDFRPFKFKEMEVK